MLLTGYLLAWWVHGRTPGRSPANAAQSVQEQAEKLHPNARSEKSSLVDDFGPSLPPEDLADALLIALRNPNLWEAGGHSWQLAHSLRPENALAVADLLRRAKGEDEAALAFNMIMNVWGRRDPKSALAYARRLTPGTFADHAVVLAVSGWAEADPDAAQSWVEALPEGRLRHDCWDSLVTSLVSSNPERALELGMRPGGPLREFKFFGGADDAIKALAWQNPERAAE